jgi:hypothetical protein
MQRRPVWVKRATLTVRRSLPVFPDNRTISEPARLFAFVPTGDIRQATFIDRIERDFGSLGSVSSPLYGGESTSPGRLAVVGEKSAHEVRRVKGASDPRRS